MYLRLYHRNLASQLIVGGLSFFGSFGDSVFKDFDAKLTEYLFALVLVDFHLIAFYWMGLRRCHAMDFATRWQHGII